MKIIKSLVAGLLVVVLMFSFTGCGLVDKVIDKLEVKASNAISSVSRDLDYEAIIDSFVADPLNSFELNVDETHAPNAAIWLQNGMGSVYTSDESVVTVTELGKVTAVGKGIAYVIIGGIGNTMYEVYRYEVYEVAAEADLSNLPEIEGIDFLTAIQNFHSSSLNTTELKVGETYSPTASVWTNVGGECFTSDASVATIAENGTVTANSTGTAYIIVTSGFGNMYKIYKVIVK